MPDSRPSRPILMRIRTIFGYTGEVFRKKTMKQTVVFFFRSFYQFGLTSRWIAFIEDFSREQWLGKPPLELVRKAFGAYFTMNGSLASREALLETHYELAARYLPQPIFAALWAGEATELGRIRGKKDDYIVWLRRADQCGTRHEGEWTAGYECASTGLLLCRITFILVHAEERDASAAIGGLQGPAKEVPKQAIVAATRDLGGLRPKDAMLLVVAGAAKALGAACMHAIDNDSHPINYRAKRRRSRMLTDYDDYWRERGGEAGGPFGFILPVKDPAEGGPGNRRRDEAKQAFFASGFGLLACAVSRPIASDALDA